MRALLPLVLATSLLACGKRAPAEPVAMRTILDPSGASIEVPVEVNNVYATNAAVLDLLLALAHRDQIHALPSTAFEYSNLARDPGPWKDVPQFTNVDTEDILALDPDLVVIADWQAPEQGAWLKDNGIPMIVLPTVTRWEELTESVRALADAIGRRERGAELQAELDARRAALAERTADQEPVRAMTYGNYGGTGSTAGGATSWNLLLELAGLTNIAAEDGRTGNYPLDIEQLLLLDPDLLVVSENLQGLTPAIGTLRSHPSAQGLRALQEDRVVSLPAFLYSTSSLHLVDAAEELLDRLGVD